MLERIFRPQYYVAEFLRFRFIYIGAVFKRQNGKKMFYELQPERNRELS